MREIDPGHLYELEVIDGDGTQILRFVKREGAGFPFNRGHYSGVICQEVIRVLIARVLYLNDQIPCSENIRILTNLRDTLLAFETRAATRHQRTLSNLGFAIEREPTCVICGHIQCEHMR